MLQNSNTADYIVIGSGVGGLSSACILKDYGKVLMLEKLHRYGGTSYTFRRGEFELPAGPLGFSYPDYVNSMFERLNIGRMVFRRKSYQIIAGKINFVIPDSFEKLSKILERIFPEENMEKAVNELKKVSSEVKGKFVWREKLCRVNEQRLKNGALKSISCDMDMVDYSVSAQEYFSSFLRDENAVNLVSSLGFKKSEQSLGAASIMWDIFCESGIWYPEIGIKGIMDSLFKKIGSKGFSFVKNMEVKKIRQEEDGFVVSCERDYFSRKVVSNIDPAFLFEIVDADMRKKLEPLYNKTHGASVLTVYAFSDNAAIPFESTHGLYYPFMDEKNEADDNRFYYREVEITVLNRLESVRYGRDVVILRVPVSYEEFVCKTKEEYYQLKSELSKELLEVVAPLIGERFTILDCATPLTYEWWGGRYSGSVAGLRWDDGYAECLVETPVENLYLAGIYAFSIPFIGGFPSSLFSGILAGELAVDENES